MRRVRKAVAGGVVGATAAVAGFAFGGGTLRDELVRFGGLLLSGFVVGFAGVYFAPANAEA